MKNYGNDLEAKAKSLPTLVGKLIQYQEPQQKFSADCYRFKSVDLGIIRLALEAGGQDDGREVTFTVEEFLKGKWAIVQEDDSAEKSEGHLAFIGAFEYFERNGFVIRAPRTNHIFPDGFRCGLFECYASFWDENKAMLKENLEKSWNDRRNEMLDKMANNRMEVE